MASDTRIRLNQLRLPERRTEMPSLEQRIAVESMSPTNTLIGAGSSLLVEALKAKAERIKQAKQAEALAKLSMGQIDTQSLQGLDRTAQMGAFKEIMNPTRIYDASGALLGNSALRTQQLRQPQPSGGQTPDFKTQRNILSRERLDALNRERDENQILGVIKSFDAHPLVRKNQQSIEAAKVIRDLATSGNPIEAAAIPTYAARMSGEVGNLSEPDKKPFGGSRSIMEKITASLQEMATGQLSPNNFEFLVALTNTIEKRANENNSIQARRFADQYSKALKVDAKDLFSQLDPYGSYDSKSRKPIVPGSGLTPEKAKRLAELRAKKASSGK